MTVFCRYCGTQISRNHQGHWLGGAAETKCPDGSGRHEAAGWHPMTRAQFLMHRLADDDRLPPELRLSMQDALAVLQYQATDRDVCDLLTTLYSDHPDFEPRWTP
jgi:hypothetical protein